MLKESSLKECKYYVKGMHCASCEILIEKKLLTIPGIEFVEASTSKEEIRIKFKGEKTSLAKINKLFKNDNYSFYNSSHKVEKSLPIITFNENRKMLLNKQKINEYLLILGIGLFIIIIFYFLNTSRLSSLIDVSSKSTLPSFFIFGLLAGFSSCAALIGGLVLSMTKHWTQLYPNNHSNIKKLEPHLLFNTGRLISFVVFGGLLGLIGNSFKISPNLYALITIIVSLLMLSFALQMLGVKYFQKLQITTPKFLARFIANESHFKSKIMPFVIGFLTFFLPCGFTISAQGLALASGNPLQGSLIMLFYSLGTTPMLLLIGLFSVEFIKRPHLSERFMKIAGILVLFFALFNINSQLNVLGFPSLSDIKIIKDTKTTKATQNNLVPIVDGKQIMKMNASTSGYSPNYFRIIKDVPVIWEITDTGTSGCTNAIISKDLFDGQIKLTTGQTSIKEFTATKSGIYKFSCWMGMISGSIEVVEEKGV